MRIRTIDDRGIVFSAEAEEVVDVCFDGRRIFSSWLLRDSVTTSDGVRLLEWPSQLTRFLEGTTDVTLVAHLSGETRYAGTVTLGEGEGRISVTDDDGRPLGIDKSGRVAQTFDTRTPEQTEPLLDAIQRVLDAIQRAGIEAFPAYGTLLGAVREGRLIGHDSDADLGYVSRHEAPVDVVRENFALARHLEQEGFTTHRYSGAAFKVDVRESDGSIRGLDVFGGFLTGGRLYLMGEVGVPFEASWIFPLGRTTLEGRSLPAPAEPERLLEAMYGEGWRVPDPAFKFATSAVTARKLDGWFRGVRAHQYDWSRRYSRLQRLMPVTGPTALARLVHEREPGGVPIVDLGGGRGSDSLWLAQQGHQVTLLDFVFGASMAVQSVAAEQGLPLVTRRMNLNEWRSWLAEGSRLAYAGGPRAILARHVVDACPPNGRDGCWRFADMALRDGGRLYLEFLRRTPEQSGRRTEDFLTPLDTAEVVSDLTARGAKIVERTDVVEDPRLPISPSPEPRPVARIVAEWPSGR